MKNAIKFILSIIMFGIIIFLAVLMCSDDKNEPVNTTTPVTIEQEKKEADDPERLSVEQMAEKAKQVDGEWIYSYYENKVNECMLSIFSKDNLYFIKIVYPNGQTSVEEIIRTDEDDRIKFTYKKQGIYNDEYFEVYMGDLNLCNKEGKVFSIAKKYGE